MHSNIENIALISSAGAGKTRALTKRFLLLYLHEANYPLHTLYGITFTNEAAFEMKKRILEYLELLIRGNTQETSAKEIIGYFTERFPDIRTRAEEKRKYLLNNLSDLNIYTFHSLFASFISSIPFAAGVLPGYRIIDDAYESIVYKDVLDQYLEAAGRDKEKLAQLQDMIEQREIRIKSNLKEIYKSILPWQDFLNRLADEEGQLNDRVRDCSNIFKKALEKFIDFIQDNESAGYTKTGTRLNRDLTKILSLIESFLVDQNIEILERSEYTRAIFRGDIAHKRYIVSYVENLGNNKREFQQILEQICRSSREYLCQLSDQQILLHLKPILGLHYEFTKAKRDNNLLSFDDIETCALRALKQNPESEYFYFRIGAEIAHLMIDEFQDTSFRQLEIIDPLINEIISVVPEEKSLFYVGDPKQAIFRWRGGSSELFNILINKYPGKIKYGELKVNYRSQKKIVDFVDRLLDKNDQAYYENTGGWVEVKNLGSFADKEAGQTAVIQETGDIIQELVDQHNYRYQDIAVLVRTNRFGVTLAEDLANRGIPCISRSRCSLLSNDDVLFVINLLRFLDNPADDFALVHVLLAPYVNIKEETLRRMILPQKTIYQCIRSSHPNWAITKILEQLLGMVRFNNPYELIFNIYQQLEMEISYALATLLDTTLEYVNDEYGHLDAFIKWLADIADSIEVKEVHPEGVQVITVHKAKGLEFDVVIVPETDWRIKSYEDKKLLFAYKGKDLEPEKIYWRRYVKYFNELKQAEQERLKQDELNLLYVALTRARQGLYIIGYDCNSKISGFWFDKITKKLGSDEYSDGEILTKPQQHISEREQNYGAIKGERLVVKEERSLYIPTERGLEIIDTPRRRSMEFGSIIHYALSLILWLDDIELKTCIQSITDKLRNKFMDDLVGYDHADQISSMLEDVLTDPDLRFLFFKDNRQAVCKNELAIYFESGKQDISGQIDRLIIEPERIFLIDYKTGENKAMYKKQLHTYKKGIVQIYEEKQIESMLIFLDKQRGNRIVKID